MPVKPKPKRKKSAKTRKKERLDEFETKKSLPISRPISDNMSEYLIRLAEMEKVDVGTLINVILQEFIIRRERKLQVAIHLGKTIKAVNKGLDDILVVKIMGGKLHYTFDINGFLEFCSRDEATFKHAISNIFKLGEHDVLVIFNDEKWMGVLPDSKTSTVGQAKPLIGDDITK